MAPRMASNSTSSLNGFVRNSTAPAFIASHAHGHVAMAGDEDDRHVRPVGELLLQLETVEPGQRHVEHQAARNGGARTGEEFLRGRECFRLPPCATD